MISPSFLIKMYKLVYVTTHNKEEAEKIAQILVEEKFVACINMFPIYSIYQ